MSLLGKKEVLPTCAWIVAAVMSSVSVIVAQDAKAPKAVGDAIALQIAEMQTHQAAGRSERAALLAWRLRSQLAGHALVQTVERRSQVLADIDSMLRDADPSSLKRLSDHVILAKRFRKLAGSYRTKKFSDVASDLDGFADTLDPAGAGLRASASSDSKLSAMEMFHESAESVYGDGEWEYRNGVLRTGVPESGVSQLMVTRYGLPAKYRLRFEFRLESSVGQLAVAFGYKSHSDFHLHEIELFESGTVLHWLWNMRGSKPEQLFDHAVRGSGKARTSWNEMALEVDGPWTTLVRDDLHITVRGKREDLSGRFGFFLSGATKGREKAQIRGLEVETQTQAAVAKVDALPERVAAACARSAKDDTRESGVRDLWLVLCEVDRSGALPAKTLRQLRKDISRALMRNDPFELKRRQAGAALGRQLGAIAKAYEKRGWTELAHALWTDLANGNARGAGPEVVRLAAALKPVEASASAPSERAVVSAKELLVGASMPWSKQPWIVKDGVLVAPAPGRVAHAVLSKAGYDGRCTIEADLQLGVDGSLTILFGYRGEADFHAVHLEHGQRERSKFAIARREIGGWRPLLTQLTNEFARKGREKWIPLRVTIDGQSIEMAVGGLPARRVELGKSLSGRVGLLVPKNGRARKGARIRNLRIR